MTPRPVMYSSRPGFGLEANFMALASKVQSLASKVQTLALRAVLVMFWYHLQMQEK